MVSILPLLILAIYFKDISDTNNYESEINELTKSAEQLKKYLTLYAASNLKDYRQIFQKAAEELGINFSVYYDKYLEFSTI